MNMDKPLRRVTIFGLLLIVALMAQINYIQGGQAEDLQKDKLNNRQFLDVFNRPRGKIIAGAETLVYSQKTAKDKEKYSRFYKDGPIFAPITGFFNGGAGGIEFAYNSLLDGRDKRITHQRWFDQFIGKKAVGADVEVTIKPNAQRVAYNALRSGTNRRAGAAVVDIRTGAIVVLAGFPSFDPNDVAPQTGLKGSRRLQILDGKPPADASPQEIEQAKQNRDVLRQPLVDKARSSSFPPGSSFKTVVAAIAMDKQGLTEQSTVPTGELILPESRKPLPNSHDGGACAGSATLIKAFAESCNTTFGKLALDMGINKLNEGAGEFGFGKPIPIEKDLDGATSQVPLSIGGVPTGPDDTARSGIGQSSVQATPLQMALVGAAVANGGEIKKPYLVQRVRAADQSVLEETKPSEFARPIKEGTADQLKRMMREVISSGTATTLQGQNVAGKTGTAEQTDRNGNEDPSHNARWFVGFSPIDNPRYGFAVVSEGPGTGAQGAGPVAGAIMRAVLAK